MNITIEEAESLPIGSVVRRLDDGQIFERVVARGDYPLGVWLTPGYTGYYSSNMFSSGPKFEVVFHNTPKLPIEAGSVILDVTFVNRNEDLCKEKLLVLSNVGVWWNPSFGNNSRWIDAEQIRTFTLGKVVPA